MDLQKPFIIIVDDDDEDRYVLNHSFTQLGLEDNVKFFGDALQFIRYTEMIGSLNVRPSLIILDYRMPHMNGKAVVNYLKSSQHFNEVPIVILSNLLTPEIEGKLYELGVTACYQKGEFEQLTEDLNEILKFAIPR